MSTSRLRGEAKLGLVCERNVAYRVVELYTLCFAHCAVRQILWKGIADWENGVGQGGLLRQDLAPKHAHKLLIKLITTIWYTPADGETNSSGTFRFRGFLAVVVSQYPQMIRKLGSRWSAPKN